MKINTSPSAGPGRGISSCLLLPLVALMLAGLAPSRAQDIISFSVDATANANRNFMFPADLAGAPGVRTNNWNNIGMNVNGGSTTADAPLLPGNITNSAGVLVPGVGAVFHVSSGGSISDRGAGTTNDLKMFDDAADGFNETSFSGYGYLNVTNIPYTNYNVYVYFLPDNGSGSANTRGGFFCITNAPTGTNCVYLANQTNSGLNQFGLLPAPTTSTFATAYIQSTTTTIGSGGVAWSAIQGGNYGVFYGLTNANCQIFYAGLGNGSGAKDPFGNFVNGGASAVRLKVVGFQIYKVPAAAPTNLYLQNASLILHAGNPGGTQVAVLANLSDGTIGAGETVNCTFSTDNTNVATVNAAGVITPGTNGTANLIVTLASAGLSLTNPITVLAPTSLSISVGLTNLLVGNGQGDVTTATLFANFSDAVNVPVNGYQFTSFSGSASISVRSNGTITALSPGSFSVTGNYDGLSATANNAGSVTTWANPISVPAMSVHVTSPTESIVFHDLSGCPGVRAGYWNNFVQNAGIVTNELDNPVNDQGNILTGTAVQIIPDFGGTLQNQSLDSIGGVTTNESALFGELLDLGMNNGTTVASELIVSNVPYASYDVYFYLWNDTSATNRPAEIIIDGNTQYRINNAAYPSQPANNGTGYVIAAPQPGSLPGSIVNVPYGNVIKFSGVTDSTLTAQIAAVGQDFIGDANPVTRVRLAGFQIVESLNALTATNLYLSPSVVPAQLPGNPVTYGLTLLANFNNGTLGGNITDLPTVVYSSSNTNVFEVDTNGNITAGLVPGTATLTITYQANTLTTTVTNLAPTSVKVVGVPNTVYLNSILGVQPAQAEAVATFPGITSVNISGFASISFVDQGSAAATLSSGGAITANNVGQASLGVSYLGTTHVSANAFSVLNTGGAPALEHQYNFNDASNAITVVDAIGGANGTVYPPLGTNKPIALDGKHAIFPGDGDYTVEPYIALPPGIINAMGDVSIEIWCGQTQRNAWGRFFGFGNTPKGNNPHVLGGTATTALQLMASYASTGLADDASPGTGDFDSPFALTNGVEYQMVIVCAPNTGVAAFYINGVLVTNSTPSATYLSSSVNDLEDWLGISLSNNDSPLAGWINNLAIYEGVMSATQVASDYTNGLALYTPPVSGPSTTMVPVTTSVSAGNLNLAWPSDHLGWRLQVQTNTLGAGLGTNWNTVTGSTSVTNVTIPVNPANGAVFYRLTYP